MHVSSKDSVDDMRITYGNSDKSAAATCTKAKHTVKAVDVMLEAIILDLVNQLLQLLHLPDADFTKRSQTQLTQRTTPVSTHPRLSKNCSSAC